VVLAQTCPSSVPKMPLLGDMIEDGDSRVACRKRDGHQQTAQHSHFLTHLVHIHVDMSQLQIDFFLHQTYYTLCRNGLQAAAVPIVLITDNSRW